MTPTAVEILHKIKALLQRHKLAKAEQREVHKHAAQQEVDRSSFEDQSQG